MPKFVRNLENRFGCVDLFNFCSDNYKISEQDWVGQ